MNTSPSGVSPENVIVVGVDGSDHAVAAAQWAAGEARRRGAALRLVHAYSPVIGTFTGPEMPPPTYEDGLRAWGVSVLDDAGTAVTRSFPDLRVTTDLRHELPALALVQASAGALMTVVGAHGSSRLLGMVLGSVALRLVTHGAGPVVIIGDDQRTALEDHERPVLVGLDGSAGSDEALAFAFPEASLRQARLIAVRVWAGAPGDSFMAPYLTSLDIENIEQEQQRLLTAQLAGWSEKYPDVVVRSRVIQGRTAAVLLGFGNEADALPATPGLVVVGSRGRGGFTGLLLGSTGQALAAHSAGPVCIVRPRA